MEDGASPFQTKLTEIEATLGEGATKRNVEREHEGRKIIFVPSFTNNQEPNTPEYCAPLHC